MGSPQFKDREVLKMRGFRFLGFYINNDILREETDEVIAQSKPILKATFLRHCRMELPNNILEQMKSHPLEFKYGKSNYNGEVVYFFTRRGDYNFYVAFEYPGNWLTFRRPFYAEDYRNKPGDPIVIRAGLGKMVEIDDRVLTFITFDRAPHHRYRWWVVTELRSRFVITLNCDTEEEAIKQAKNNLKKMSDAKLERSIIKRVYANELEPPPRVTQITIRWIPDDTEYRDDFDEIDYDGPFISLHAVAIVEYDPMGKGGTRIQTFESSGLYGIIPPSPEADAEGDWKSEMELNEISELRDHLRHFNINMEAFDEAVTNRKVVNSW